MNPLDIDFKRIIFKKVAFKSIVVLLLMAMLSACEHLFFYPSKEWVRTPKDIGLEYRDVSIKSSPEVSLHGWWLPAATDDEVKGTVYFLHGNAQNISTHIASVYWLPDAGYNVFLLDYRGYGKSTGEPGFPEVMADMKSGWQWLLQQPDVVGRPLFILGQSLGAAVSGYVVGTEPELRQTLSGVVLDAGFASYPRVAQEAVAKSWLTWILQWPVGSTTSDQYDLEKVVANIQPIPLLLIHGNKDQVISAEHTKKLFDLAGEPKQLLSYSGGHIETFQLEENRQALIAFFANSES